MSLNDAWIGVDLAKMTKDLQVTHDLIQEIVVINGVPYSEMELRSMPRSELEKILAMAGAARELAVEEQRIRVNGLNIDKGDSSMRLTNLTAYDTYVLHRIISAVHRITSFGAGKRHVFVAYRNQRLPAIRGPVWFILRLPPLTGHEWHHLLRQEAGIETTPGEGEGPPTCVAVGIQAARLMGYSVIEELLTQSKLWGRIPRLLPLKKPKERKPPEDPRVLRLRTVEKRQKSWMRKLKLATTKLKKLARERGRLEKKLQEVEHVAHP